METEGPRPAANREGILGWCAFALLIMIAHVILVSGAWLLKSGLAIPLLMPGILVNAMLDLPKPRNIYAPAVIVASASFYGALAVLYCFRRRLALVIAGAAVVGGFAVGMGRLVRAIGSP